MRADVSALYVDPRGPYPRLLADCWDEVRDAKLYAGPNPVVAHPPCGPWGKLRGLYSGHDKDCGIRAVAQVQQLGGVLEQPADSKLWDACSLPSIRDGVDQFGGHSVQVDQVQWGHVARKRTWLYVVGVSMADVAGAILPWTRGRRAPTHWCSGTHTPGQRGTVPPGIKVCSAQQRRRTPVAFAEWLISLAAQAKR